MENLSKTETDIVDTITATRQGSDNPDNPRKSSKKARTVGPGHKRRPLISRAKTAHAATRGPQNHQVRGWVLSNQRIFEWEMRQSFTRRQDHIPKRRLRPRFRGGHHVAHHRIDTRDAAPTPV